MSEALERLEETWLELCPHCQGYTQGCLVCFDAGYVAHGCQGPIALTPEVEQCLRELRELPDQS